MTPTKKATPASVLLWLVLLPIPILWCGLAHFGQLQFLENKLLDLRFRIRGEIAAPVKLIYVDIDTVAVEKIGERPVNRLIYATVAKALLDAGGARAVGFDFVLSIISTSRLVDQTRARAGNEHLRRVILAHPKGIVLAAQYTDGSSNVIRKEGTRDIPLIRKGKTDPLKNDVPEMPDRAFILDLNSRPIGRVGLIDVDVEHSGDEIPRWVPLFVHEKFQTLYHFSLQLVLQNLGLDEDAVKISEDRIDLVRKDKSVALTIPLHEQQLLEANWFSHWQSPLNPRYSLAEVIDAGIATESKDPEQRAIAAEFFADFKDAIVLIGPVDPLLQDLEPSPFDPFPVPKVGLHGNLVKTILSGKYLQRLPEWSMWVIVVGLTLIVSALAIAGGARGFTAKIFALVALGGYTGASFYLFSNSHIVMPMAAPLGSAFTTSFVAIIWQLIVEEKRGGRIKGMFKTYLSPQLVERMVESGEEPKLGGHDAEITAYFSDIQSFSSFSEVLNSERLVELMNEYLTACTAIVLAQGGTLDKYIGDAVVAMYGAPVPLKDHAYRACVATQLVHLKIAELRQKWQSEGEKWPTIVWNMQTRIGLNTGLCTIGNMGSLGTKDSPPRFNYTMMGDNVNLAARMESGAKQYGVYTMVAESTKLACEQHGAGQLVFRYLDKIVVKGRSIPVPIHEVVGLKANLTAQTFECLGVYEQGIARYLAQDWDAAEALFKRSVELEPNQPGKTPGVESNPSLTLIKRCHAMRAHPPAPGWDGVYVMKEK